MTYQPLVSIIINTHNSIEFLTEALESACAQTYPNTEILVYDNASHVNVYEMVAPFEKRVTYFRSEDFLTLGQARNEALKQAKGELIDFLDADDLFLANKLEKQVPYFEKAEVGIVHSNSHILRKTGNQWKDEIKNTPFAFSTTHWLCG